MKAHIMMNLFILALPVVSFAQTYIYKCPDSEYAMSPIVDSKVIYDKKTGLYTYKYKIKNKSDALVPIHQFVLSPLVNVQSIKSNKNWDFDLFDNIKLVGDSKTEGLSVGIKFDKDGYPYGPDGNVYDIYPGKTIEGFEFKSQNPPGPIKIRFSGGPLRGAKIHTSDGKPVENFHTVIPKAELDKIMSEGEKTCPGYSHPDLENVDNPRDYGLVDVTTGPIPPTRVAAKLRMRKITEKKWRGSCESEPDIEVLPIDTGKIQLMLFGSRDVDVAKIDLGSLRFGQGRAKPVNTAIVNDFRDKDGEVDDDIKEHIKKNNVQHLLMEFNLDDIDIRCDSDRALFLDGKIEGKDLFGAVKIKHGSCSDKKNNAKEIKKAKEYELKNNTKSERRKKGH